MVFLLERKDARAVVEGGSRVVDGARSNYDEKTAVRIGILDYTDAFVATVQDGRLGCEGLADFMLEEIGRGYRCYALD